MSEFTHNRALVAALLLVVLSGGALGGIWYWLTTAQQELSELSSRVGESTQTQTSIQSMRTLVRETQLERNELSGYFLEVEDPAPFLELVEAAASDAGVVLEIAGVTVETEGTQRFVSVSLENTGSFEACYRFLELIEHLPYAVSLRQMSLSRAATADRGGWSGSMLLRILARP